MMDRDQLLGCVPVGKANALPCLEIWKLLGMWSDTSVMVWLKKLSAAGQVEMELQPHPAGRQQWVFWRETWDI